MRESIGGTWIMGIVMLFIVLFASFLALSINYTKAFRVKNEIINIIEKHEGYTTGDNINGETSGSSSLSTEAEILQYLDGMGYDKNMKVACPTNIYGSKPPTPRNGICVRQIGNDGEPAYYKVTSFVHIELPLGMLRINVPVSGETKTIHNNYSTLEE